MNQTKSMNIFVKMKNTETLKILSSSILHKNWQEALDKIAKWECRIDNFYLWNNF